MNDHAHASLELTANELLLLNNSLNEVCNGPDAIPIWEFQTRMGRDRAEALRLLQRVNETLDALPADPANL